MDLFLENDIPSNKLISQVQAGIGLIDTNDRLAQVNPYMAGLLDCTIQDMTGQPIVSYIKPDQQPFLQTKLDGLKHGHNFFIPVSLLGRDGRHIECLLSFSRILSHEKNYLGAAFFVLDIHQDLFLQLLLERQVLQKGRELSGLNQIMTEIARTWDLKKLLNLVFSAIQTATGFTGGGFFVYRSEKPTLFAYPQAKFYDLPIELSQAFRKIRKARPELLTKKVWDLSKINPSPEHVKLHQAFFKLFLPENYANVKAVLVFSFTDNKRTNGVFGFYHSSEKAFSPEMVEMADIVTSHAAITIENMYLIQDKEILATEKERLRLSRELHDSVAQGLYSLMLYGEASRRALAANKTALVADNLDEMIQLSREAMSDLRLLIFELRPPIIKEIGLTGAIVARLEAIEKRSGTQAECNIFGQSNLSTDIETQLYWIVHEALNNVLKHSKADHLCVDIHFTRKSVIVNIKDDGVGFEIGKSGTSSGVGLKSMSERVEHLGGKLKVDSELGKGTTIEIVLDNK